MGKITQHFGLSVKEAEDGKKALDMMKTEPFDIVFLDLLLPGMHALEALTHIRENHPETVVIIVTDQTALETALESMKLGATDYLVKTHNGKKINN
jgi:DNA-binding response OmpR family regulator